MNLQIEAKKIMTEVLSKTKSMIAYVAAVHNNQFDVKMLAWSSGAMSGCQLEDKPIDYNLGKMGLWGDAMREKKVIVTNDYNASTRPNKRGYPAGHVAIKRHMNGVVMNGTKVIGIIGVGNGFSDYSEDTIKEFENYLKTLSNSFIEMQKNAF
jgi:hypothetical protein